MTKTLLLTGASSDIGSALIRRVVSNYDTIICHYRKTLDVIDDLKEEFVEKIVPIYADFADLESTKSFIGEVLDRDLKPNHFVHLSSSSSSIDIRFNKTDRLQFENELSISFLSAVECCRAYIPFMAKSHYGKVIFMLSSFIVNEPEKPYSTAYVSVKHALYGLMKTLASEYASKGVTVNAVSPSMMDTKFLLIPEIEKELNAENSPIKRLLKVEDVVPIFEFLLSSGADCITGQNIAVTAGN